MVVGLDHFSEYFSSDKEHYVLIGGSACYAHFEEVGLPFRATQDLDIVLCVETLSEDFSDKFKDYIRLGSYEVAQRSSDLRKCFYRFQKPQSPGFPRTIELFSRRGDLIENRYPTAAPLPIADSADSLSALLLNDDYYSFIVENKVLVRGLSIASDVCLIALKVRAWLDLSQKKNEGKPIDSNDIRKHKLDVFRLARLLPTNLKQSVLAPDTIKKDIMEFLVAMEQEEVDLRVIGGKQEVLLMTVARHFGLPDFIQKEQKATEA